MQPLTSKERKRLKAISSEIDKLTNQAVDILSASTEVKAGFLYLDTLDFDGVNGSVLGKPELLAEMLETIGRDQPLTIGPAIILAALRLTSGQ